MSEKIWYRDLANFITTDNYMNFFPSNDMNMREKINSVMRFMLYFTIILFVINRKNRVFYVLISGAVLSYIVHEIDIDGYTLKRERYMNGHDNTGGDKPASRRRCTKPDKLNPFMNVLMTEYVDNVDRPRACDVDDTKVKKAMKRTFEHDLYRNVDDVFDRNYSYRQFYTTPNTTIPNDQEAFAKWLYFNEGASCKEGNGNQCYQQINGWTTS